MTERTYQFILGTDTQNRDIAVTLAGMELEKIHDQLDRRKFDAHIMDVVVYGEDEEGVDIGVCYDVLYDCADTDYLDTIQRRLELNRWTEFVEEVYYETPEAM